MVKLRVGAVQDDGTLAPLSAWSDEPAFGQSMGFVVAEDDLQTAYDICGGSAGGRGRVSATIHAVLPTTALSYGSRQVGGGKGPGNPHGEESERVYYVDRSALRVTWVPAGDGASGGGGGGGGGREGKVRNTQDVELVVRPELEITW